MAAARIERSAPRAPGGLRAQLKAERLRVILGVARELFHEKGFDQAGTLEIASRAGVGAGTVFKYFPTKEALLMAVVNADLAEVNVRAALQAQAKTGLLERLTCFYQGGLDFHLANAELARVFIRLPIRPTVEVEGRARVDGVETMIARTLTFVTQALTDGELKPEVPVDDLAANCFAIFLDVLQRALTQDPAMSKPDESLKRRLALQILLLRA